MSITKVERPILKLWRALPDDQFDQEDRFRTRRAFNAFIVSVKMVFDKYHFAHDGLFGDPLFAQYEESAAPLRKGRKPKTPMLDALALIDERIAEVKKLKEADSSRFERDTK